MKQSATINLRVLVCGSAGSGKTALIEQLAGATGSMQKEPVEGFDAGAYRFSTPKRKFLIADTPGNGDSTRNIASSGPRSDCAILVADATTGIETQIRRHACMLSVLGIRRIALAVNKMDRSGYAKDRFNEIVSDFSSFADQLHFEDVSVFPVSTVGGENILETGQSMAWYSGPPLMAHLESIDTAPAAGSFRLNVESAGAQASGIVLSGTIRRGDEVLVLPAARTSLVENIVTDADEREEANAGDIATLTLRDAVDCSEGDILCSPDEPAEVSDQIAAHVIWTGTEPMLPGRNYILKAGSQSANASVSTLKYRVNVDNLEHQAAKTLEQNDVGYCNLAIARPIVFDPYEVNRETGRFILVDRLSKETVATGTIDFGLRRATNISWQALDVDKATRAGQKGQKPCVLWFTGLSGSGKSTVASLLEKRLHARGQHTYVLDGDNVRHGLNKDLGFTDADRVENIRRVAETAKLFTDAGLIVMVSFISPFRSERRMARELFAEDEFLEIYVDTPLDVCEERDPKGLYRKARAGEIKNFTGIDSDYEPPERAEIRLDASTRSPDELVAELIETLEKKKFI